MEGALGPGDRGRLGRRRACAWRGRQASPRGAAGAPARRRRVRGRRHGRRQAHLAAQAFQRRVAHRRHVRRGEVRQKPRPQESSPRPTASVRPRRARPSSRRSSSVATSSASSSTIVSTETGRALVTRACPTVATTPDMTATLGGGPARHHRWDADARCVPRARRRAPRQLVAEGRALGHIAIPPAPPAPPRARRSSHTSTGAAARTPNTERPQQS